MLARIRLLASLIGRPFQPPRTRRATVRLTAEPLDTRVVPAVEAVSINSAGTATGGSGSLLLQTLDDGRDSSSAMSADGRYVVFSTNAIDLGGSVGDPVFEGDYIYVRDRVTGKSTQVNTNVSGYARDGGPFPVITPDGRYVAFAGTSAKDGKALDPTVTIPDGAANHQAFVRDMQTGKVTLVSTASPGVASKGNVERVSISDDGNRVCYVGAAGDDRQHVFVHDVKANTTIEVSRTPAGGSGNGNSFAAAISGDGSTVVFASDATNLTTLPDANNAPDLFAFTFSDGKVRPITVNAAGTAMAEAGGGNTANVRFRMDQTGTKVLFGTRSTDVTTGNALNFFNPNIFIRDLKAGKTTLVSADANGKALPTSVGNATISRDGKFVAFGSTVPVTDAGGLQGEEQVYLKNLETGGYTLASHLPDGSRPGPASYSPTMSADGRYTVFTSGASLVPSQPLAADGVSSIYVFDRLTDTVSALAPSKEGTSVVDLSFGPTYAISRNGAAVAFATTANAKALGFTDGNDAGSGAPSNGDVFATAVPVVTPRPQAVFAVGGSDGSVRVLGAAGAVVGAPFRPFDMAGAQYKGLVQVAVGDLTGDGKPDLFVSAASPAGGAGLDATKAGKVFVYDGAALAAGTAPTTPLRVFTPFATTDGPGGTTGAYVNGLNVAVADVDGDGKMDVIAGTRGGTGGAGGGNREYGRVAVVSGAGTGNTLIGAVVKPFGNGYEKGVVLAAGSLDGDNKAEIAVTRGGPVAPGNPNQSVKLKAYRLVGTALAELNLSGGPGVFAPFEAATAGDGGAITRDARVAFVDPDGDGKSLLLFTALDRGAEPSGNKVRVGAFSVDGATGKATLVSTGTGSTPTTFLVGSAVADHAIGRAPTSGKGTNLALVTESGSSGVQYLDPLTGAAVPGGFALTIAAGGVSVAGF